MFHSDLRQEIAYLQAQLDYKRRKLAEGLQNNTPLQDMGKLFSEIKVVEQKLQYCFEESNAQMEGE
ncbi:MAG TPA: hypothetical protein VGN63_12140 [Flavisolibacter sp.]|jgi:hypothetical protein|nr:hypothetical protein [Flavisolibacter sp.]